MKKTRCGHCHKKCNLINFECKCGKQFCIKHRYYFEHHCEFDYKYFEREKLKENLPQITANKIDKI